MSSKKASLRHLEGVEDEVDEEFREPQGDGAVRGRLIGDEGKQDQMATEQGDERKGGLRQPGHSDITKPKRGLRR